MRNFIYIISLSFLLPLNSFAQTQTIFNDGTGDSKWSTPGNWSVGVSDQTYYAEMNTSDTSFLDQNFTVGYIQSALAHTVSGTDTLIIDRGTKDPGIINASTTSERFVLDCPIDFSNPTGGQWMYIVNSGDNDTIEFGPNSDFILNTVAETDNGGAGCAIEFNGKLTGSSTFRFAKSGNKIQINRSE